MLVGVAAQHISEEWRTGTQDHFVSLDLTVITSKSNIEEIFLFTDFFQCHTYVRLKVIPPEAELLGTHF